MAMSRPIAVVALMLAVASSFGCAGRTGADGRGALWRKASPTSAAPELQRVNTLLADLAERLRPGLPCGLERSVSFGSVSRKGARLTVAAPGFDFIQTDAAINPGNSGGPLVNMAGEVIGVNSMAARNGSIGFAIPSNLVQQLVPQLATKGRVEWGWLGVSIGEVTEADLERR